MVLVTILLQVQILNRYAEVFEFFSVFVSSAAIYYVIKNRKFFHPLTFYYTYIAAFFTIWPAISKVISQQYWWHMLYIWDAGDWNTIPINYFLKEL